MYRFYIYRANYIVLKYKLMAIFYTSKYKFKHWFFKWNVDEEKDLVFSVCNVIHFIKYKEHTVIKFGRKQYESAPKYIKEINEAEKLIECLHNPDYLSYKKPLSDR